MLKKIFFGNKAVPVPIPINTLAEAIDWVETTFIKKGQMITNVILNDQEINVDDIDPKLGATALSSDSRLMIKIETPKELALQIIDATRDLASVIDSRLKPLAVHCWQLSPNELPTEIKHINTDLDLIFELVDHLMGFVDRTHIDTAPVQGIVLLIKRVHKALDEAYKRRDWQSYARILLNRLEPLIKDMVVEAEGLQLRIFSIDESEINSETERSSPGLA